MNTDAQPDLLASAKKASAQRPAAAKKTKKAKKAAGTAVAVDDPKKRQEIATSQQQQQTSNFLAIIMQAATNPDYNVEKMQALLDMQRQIEERDSKKAFTIAFALLQDALPTIRRDGKIEVRKKDASGERTGPVQQATPYATYPAIMKIVKPILASHGFAFSSIVEPVGDGRIFVISTLSHREGHSVTSRFPLPAETSGSKNNVQGWGSAQSYGMRYNAISMLNIVSEAMTDADTDGHEGKFVKAKDGLAQSTETETISDEQLSELNVRMTKCKVPLDKVLKHYDLKKLDDLPVKLLAAALKACDDYADNQKRVQQDEGFPGDRISSGGQRGTTHR